MTPWEARLNRELGQLNEAHSTERMGKPEYRQRRRALLQAALHSDSSASHTLRRPAGSRLLPRPTLADRALPMPRGAKRPEAKTSGRMAWWLVGGALGVSVAALLLAWVLLG